MKKLRRHILLLVVAGWIHLCFASPHSVIYIYDDAGVSQESLLQTQKTFKALLGEKYRVQTLDAAAVKKPQWMKDAALLVMPGGADVPYAQKLQGVGNQRIKKYVEAGGAFLGICAGGYYGARWVEFDKNGPLAVVEPRELSFFPGKAIGPILAKYDYRSNSGARVANIRLKNGISLPLYYNGGAFFSQADTYPDVTVLGWYQFKQHHKLPAIVSIKYGKGMVILSGVHFEYNPEDLNQDDKFLTGLIPELTASSEQRKQVIRQFFSLLGL